MENLSVLSYLVLSAFGLLVILTSGVGYLTYVEWRDRRRRERERRDQRRRSGQR